MTLIFKGVVGLSVRILTAYDLTGYSKVRIRWQKPDGTVTEITPTSVTAASGFVDYTTVAADFSISGEYQVQVYVEFPAGNKLFGEIDKIRIYEPLAVTV